ncbi:hypothetical protein [Burkholderia cepacia]|uniref:hypothetical protein n=1 Tax=Burkholderia cepacia TaxID=292 RepID=UPI0020CA5275|nr:hypothetical protein [Burkholderia cepacia]MDO5945531.1 hypothetical protein [Burkholderia cepacia]
MGLAGGINVFQYAVSPVQWIDPLGLSGTLAGRRADKAQRLPASQRPNTVAVIVLTLAHKTVPFGSGKSRHDVVIETTISRRL